MCVCVCARCEGRNKRLGDRRGKVRGKGALRSKERPLEVGADDDDDGVGEYDDDDGGCDGGDEVVVPDPTTTTTTTTTTEVAVTIAVVRRLHGDTLQPGVHTC